MEPMKSIPGLPRRQPIQFLYFIFLQILSSAFLVLPILIAIKQSSNDVSNIIAYFSFASNFAIGFTKSVLITSLSLKSNSKSRNFYSGSFLSDYQIPCILVFLQFTLAIILLENSITTLLILHLGLVAMIYLEFYCQSKAIYGDWMGAVVPYMSLIILFISIFTFISFSSSISSTIIIEIWAVSVISVSLILFYKNFQNRKNEEKFGTSSDKTQFFLAIDFLLNYGLMQLIYSIGTTLTTSSEMIKYRLLMFLGIPTNVVMQILSTSGLNFIFGDTNRRRKNLLIFDVLTFLPLVLIVWIFSEYGSKNLGLHLGEIWSEIPSLLPYFLLMSCSAIVLTHTAMIVKWQFLTRSLLNRRILISAIQVPVTLFAIKHRGAIGILESLMIFNILFTFVNIVAIRNKQSHEN